MTSQQSQALSKVPEVTLVFWIIKILSTTLGETGGDAVSMTLGLGYLTSTFIFAILFVFAVWIQIKAHRFHPLIYWFTIITTTTVGTTLADFTDRSLGIGYAGGSTLLLLLLLTSLWIWHKTLGSVSINTVNTPVTEGFYWVTILFSQTLGTALGDWVADTQGLGYEYSMIIFGGALALVALAYATTRVSHVLLFWLAFILTRPLGAVLGDFIDKPIADGGLALSRITASAVLLGLILLFIFVFKQKPSKTPH